MSYIIVLDIGTTALKTYLFDKCFNLVTSDSQSYALITPDNDIIEYKAEDYWTAAKLGIKSVISGSGINPSEIRKITVTTQGETLIPVDRHGMALHNAIVWLDSRASEEADIIRKKIGDQAYYLKTGIPEPGPANPLCKILWFKRKRPNIYKKVYKFLLLEDYIIFKLTSRYVSEPSIMSSTGYLDINTGTLWADILETLEIDTCFFPEIKKCGQSAGSLLLNVADFLGMSENVSVHVSAMDQSCSAIGAGNVAPGTVTETTGTALVLAATVAFPDFNSNFRIPIIRHYGDRFLLLPYCPAACIILNWFINEFYINEYEEGDNTVKRKSGGKSVYDCLDEITARVPPGCDGLTLLPHFAGKLSPDVNPNATGVFHGVSLNTTKGHFIRAIFEGIGFMLKESIDMLNRYGLEINSLITSGGGSKSVSWNLIKADICNIGITTLRQKETTALGAAILCSSSSASDIEYICKDVIKDEYTFYPKPENVRAYRNYYNKYLKLYDALRRI